MLRNNFFIIVCIWLYCLPSHGYSQIAPRVDSLKALLGTTSGKARVGVLHQLSDQLERSNIDSALAFAREAVAVSRRMDDQKLIAESERKLGRLLSLSGDNPDAVGDLLKAKRLFEQLGDLRGEALTMENLGAMYKRQGNYKRALEYYFSALNLKEKVGIKENISRDLVSIGLINEQMNQTEKSIPYYKRALQIAEEKDDASSIAIIGTQLGDAYASVGDKDKALETMKRALQASKRLPGEHAQATILLNMSSFYKGNKSYDQALEANRRALALAKEMKAVTLESLSLQNIAQVYSDMGQPGEANEYYLQALSVLENTGVQKQIISALNAVAQTYLQLDEPDKAIQYAGRAAKVARQINALEDQPQALKILAEVYIRGKAFKEAFLAQQRLIRVKDSLFNREQARQIAEMQTRYDTQKKEQEIALLHKEQEKAGLIRNVSIAGIILVIIIGLLVYNRQRLKIKKNRTELENTRLKEQQLKQDLKFRNKQLTTHSLNLVQKNEVMKELKQKIKAIQKESEGDLHKRLRDLDHLVDYSFNLDKDWEEFKLYFEKVHTGFFDTLKKQYPDLTTSELRLSALVKLQLTTKEIATIMSISPDSVKTARYRLRKKLGMETEENLTEFMMGIEKEAADQV